MARNYRGTADYFERRAAKATTATRRCHFMAVARQYHERARREGDDGAEPMEAFSPSRRERIAAMFRALGDPASIVRVKPGLAPRRRLGTTQ